MMLLEILNRAKFLVAGGSTVFAAPHLLRFLSDKSGKRGVETLNDFMLLDDHDIISAVKVWMGHADVVLSKLCSDLLNRRTFKIELRNLPVSETEIDEHRSQLSKSLGVSMEEAKHFVLTGRLANAAYDQRNEQIGILYKNGELEDISEAADNLNIHALSAEVEKYYLAVARV